MLAQISQLLGTNKASKAERRAANPASQAAQVELRTQIRSGAPRASANWCVSRAWRWAGISVDAAVRHAALFQ